VDWGLSDVLMAVGPLGGILRDGVRQLMAKSAAFDPHAAEADSSGNGGIGKYDWKSQLSRDNALDQEFIGVTHSLGSYLLFNTLNPEFDSVAGQNLSASEATRKTAEANAMRYIFERTSLVYFFANQLEMLEITNLESAPDSSTTAMTSRGLAPAPFVPTSPAANFRTLVNRWNDYQTSFQGVLHPSDNASRELVQVVAWSDPSDVITYRVPVPDHPIIPFIEGDGTGATSGGLRSGFSTRRSRRLTAGSARWSGSRFWPARRLSQV
jgi:hypothetical protein